MKTTVLIIMLAFCTASWTSYPANDQNTGGATTETVVERYLDNYSFFIECANDGVGEWVHMTGGLIYVFHITENAKGFTLKVNNHPNSLRGTGEITGDQYVATGAFNQTYNLKAGEVFSMVSTYRIVGQGPSNNLIGDYRFHGTVNANGTLTVYNESFTLRCQ
jgi:hypothetical protein